LKITRSASNVTSRASALALDVLGLELVDEGVRLQHRQQRGGGHGSKLLASLSFVVAGRAATGTAWRVR
jgi:hypothetical protein